MLLVWRSLGRVIGFLVASIYPLNSSGRLTDFAPPMGQPQSLREEQESGRNYSSKQRVDSHGLQNYSSTEQQL